MPLVTTRIPHSTPAVATPGPTTPVSATPIRRFGVLLSPTHRGARLARLLAVAELDRWELPTETAAQVVAELATNAVLHARVPGRNFRLALTVTRASTRTVTLHIEVTDPVDDELPTPARGPAPARAEAGRGLLLVQALTDHWGVSLGPPPRKTVWARLSLPST